MLGAVDGGAARTCDVDVAARAARIRAALEKTPLYFAEIAERFSTGGFAAVTRPLGTLHAAGALGQDSVGRHCLAGSAPAATPPATRGSS